MKGMQKNEQTFRRRQRCTNLSAIEVLLNLAPVDPATGTLEAVLLHSLRPRLL